MNTRPYDFLLKHKNDPRVAKVFFLYWADSDMLGVDLKGRPSIKYLFTKSSSYVTSYPIRKTIIAIDTINLHNVLNPTFLIMEHERAFSKLKGIQETPPAV